MRSELAINLIYSSPTVLAATTNTLFSSLCISVWAGGASLLILGLSIPQIVGVMIVARVLIVAFIMSNGWMGGEWHIGFTVAQRYEKTYSLSGLSLGLVLKSFPG